MMESRNAREEEFRAVMGSLASHTLLSRGPSHEEIAQRAYERWEQGGRQPGMDALDWLRAEEELTGASL
ncbi:MAG: DUF2934 domain-containing protein [Rhodospirillales bacterium]|nr:DUF2934 domain-containing protein [Acetobacter sp.]